MMKTMSGDAVLWKGVTYHTLRACGSWELFRSNVPEKLVQQRTEHRSLEALRKYEHIAEEQVICLPCPRWYETAGGEARRCYSFNTSNGTASHATWSNAAATLATMLQPDSSDATASTNTTVEWLYTQQLYHQHHQYSTASASATRTLLHIDINEFLNFIIGLHYLLIRNCMCPHIHIVVLLMYDWCKHLNSLLWSNSQ